MQVPSACCQFCISGVALITLYAWSHRQRPYIELAARILLIDNLKIREVMKYMLAPMVCSMAVLDRIFTIGLTD